MVECTSGTLTSPTLMHVGGGGDTLGKREQKQVVAVGGKHPISDGFRTCSSVHTTGVGECHNHSSKQKAATHPFRHAFFELCLTDLEWKRLKRDLHHAPPKLAYDIEFILA